MLGRFEVRKIVDMELSLIKQEPFSSRNVQNCKGVCVCVCVGEDLNMKARINSKTNYRNMI